MKEIRIALEDKEYSLLIKTKKGLTWKEWLMRKDMDAVEEKQLEK